MTQQVERKIKRTVYDSPQSRTRGLALQVEKDSRLRAFHETIRNVLQEWLFENEQGEAVTVNGDRYRAMLNEFLFKQIEEQDIGNIWFQQDGAICHIAEATLDVLRPRSK